MSKKGDLCMQDEILKIPVKKFRGETEVVSARLPQDLVWELTKISKDTGRSRNEIIEMCLSFAIERIQVDKEKGDES